MNGSSEKLPPVNITLAKVDNQNLLIVPALGHLYTIVQKGQGWQYPVYDFEWVPDYQSVKNSSKITDFHRRKEAVVELIRHLAKKSSQHLVMTDYDEEGEVIGGILINHLIGEEALHNARRMKFSFISFDMFYNF